MFSTDEGRKQLSESAGFERLVVVTLHRDHLYDNLDAIKAELSSKVMELAPPKLGNKQVCVNDSCFVIPRLSGPSCSPFISVATATTRGECTAHKYLLQTFFLLVELYIMANER